MLASCFPKGFNLTQDGDQFLDSPCANGLVFNYTYNFTANTSRIDKVRTKNKKEFLLFVLNFV